jgi:two-component system chemotaxis sensor kinase CheA
VSGRGIGLDVVRDVAERLGGQVTVATTPGRGATVELAVPLSLLSLETLTVDGADTVVAIPLDSVRHTLRIRPEQITHTTTGDNIVHNGQTVPYLPLSQLLAPNVRPAPVVRTGRAGQTAQAAGTGAVAVVLAGSAGSVALGADRLRGLDTVVVRGLPELAPTYPGIGGVCLDGEGNPRLVLDADGLFAAAGHTAHHPPPGDPDVPARLPILVIDDSLTTRMLERGILESAGYDVEVAASGEEAIGKAHDTPYCLFLVDIEMPGMDGFTFIETTRADPALRHIPAILVSSRASAEDRQRGLAAGACMHIEKADFNQNELLDQIQNLVG